MELLKRTQRATVPAQLSQLPRGRSLARNAQQIIYTRTFYSSKAVHSQICLSSKPAEIKNRCENIIESCKVARAATAALPEYHD